MEIGQASEDGSRQPCNPQLLPAESTIRCPCDARSWHLRTHSGDMRVMVHGVLLLFRQWLHNLIAWSLFLFHSCSQARHRSQWLEICMELPRLVPS